MLTLQSLIEDHILFSNTMSVQAYDGVFQEGRSVVTVKDVTADKFIVAFSQHLKRQGRFELPKWSEHVKTGVQKSLSEVRNCCEPLMESFRGGPQVVSHVALSCKFIKHYQLCCNFTWHVASQSCTAFESQKLRSLSCFRIKSRA